MNVQTASGARAFAPYSLENLISGAARLRPEAIAFADRTTICPYGLIAGQVAALARLLTDLGLKPGDRLVLAGGAEVSLIIALAAMLRGGFEPALASLDLGTEDLANYARALGAVALVGPTSYGDFKLAETYFAAAAAAPSIRLLATLGPGEIDGAADLGATAVLRYAAANPGDGLERGKPVPPPARIFTFDRRRGRPVAHEQTTLMAAGLDLVARAEIGRATPIISTVPPTSFAGLVAGPFAALLSGVTLHLHGPFAAEDFLKVRAHAAGAHLVIPAALAAEFAGASLLDGLASAVLVSRSPTAAEFAPPALSAPCPLIDLYALGETAAVAERRRGEAATPPATEAHFVGFDDARVLTIERADDHFRGAAVTSDRA